MDTESRFGVIKNIIFKNQVLPTRPDTFVRTLLDYVHSMAKLARIADLAISHLTEEALKKEECSTSEEDVFEKPPIENWRGLGESSAPITKNRSHRTKNSVLNPQV